MPMNPYLKWQRPVIAGPPELTTVSSRASNMWFGRTALNSDTNGFSVTISTAMVASDSLLLFSVQQFLAAGSNASPMQYQVATIGDRSMFRIAAVASSTCVGSAVVMWWLLNGVTT